MARGQGSSSASSYPGPQRLSPGLARWGKPTRAPTALLWHLRNGPLLYTVRSEDGKVIAARLFPDLAASITAAESSAVQTAW